MTAGLDCNDKIAVARAIVILLRHVADDGPMLECARLAVENALVELRDARIGLPTRNNGLTIREYDGRASTVIRLGPEDAMRIGLKAIADFIELSTEHNNGGDDGSGANN